MSTESSDEHTPLLGSMILDSPTEAHVLSVNERKRGSSWFMASMIIINATLGAGLLDFPAAFNAGGGIAVSMIMQLFLALLATFSFILLCWLSDLRASVTYQDTMGSLCGPMIKQICSVMMILYTYGSCVAYLVVVGDESDQVFFTWYGENFSQTWYLNRKFILAITSLLLILPFCYAKKIDFLKYASSLATVGVIYFVFLAVYVYYMDGLGHPVEIKTKPDHWTDVFKLVSTVCFAYQSHLSIVPTYACMEKRTMKNISVAVLFAMIISFAAYSIVGIYGYLTYGIQVKPDIISSFPLNNVTVALGFFIFAIKTVLTYPVMEYVGREALETFWVQTFKLERIEVILGERQRRFWFATTWFLTSLLIGLFIPNILTVIGLLGSLAALFIFVFPGLCLLKSVILMEDSMEQPIRMIGYCISIFYIILGAFIFGLTTAQCIEYFFKPATKVFKHIH